MRTDYGDVPMEWVELRRVSPKCLLKARICPQHKIRQKSYSIIASVDEGLNEIDYATCHDCVALQTI